MSTRVRWSVSLWPSRCASGVRVEDIALGKPALGTDDDNPVGATCPQALRECGLDERTGCAAFATDAGPLPAHGIRASCWTLVTSPTRTPGATRHLAGGSALARPAASRQLSTPPHVRT